MLNLKGLIKSLIVSNLSFLIEVRRTQAPQPKF